MGFFLGAIIRYPNGTIVLTTMHIIPYKPFRNPISDSQSLSTKPNPPIQSLSDYGSGEDLRDVGMLKGRLREIHGFPVCLQEPRYV